MAEQDLETHVETNGHVRAADVPLTPRQASIAAGIIKALAFSTERAARWLTLSAVIALWFLVALWRPDPWRLAAATSLTVLVFLPMWWRILFPKEPRDG